MRPATELLVVLSDIAEAAGHGALAKEARRAAEKPQLIQIMPIDVGGKVVGLDQYGGVWFLLWNSHQPGQEFAWVKDSSVNRDLSVDDPLTMEQIALREGS